VRPRPSKPVATPATRERRTPVPVALRAALLLYNGKEKVCGWVRRISTGGMYLQSRARFPGETEVVVEALVWEGDSARPLRLKGWVAYEDRRGMGIQFEPPPADALADLRLVIDRFETLSPA
jgi:PilZ domain